MAFPARHQIRLSIPPAPRLGCIPGIATGAGSLDCRAVEFLEYWRWRKRPLEPTRDTLPRELDRGAKLALEFASLPEYPEATVMRDMKRHQTLAIA